jgi:hypothetical protein
MSQYVKDPSAVLPFTVDWSAWLAAEDDTADTATWIVPDGLVQEVDPAPSLADGKATVWLSGGTVGETYAVTCRLATVGGRIDDRTIRIRIEQR